MSKRAWCAVAVTALPLLLNVAIAADTGGGDGEDALFADSDTLLTSLADFITGPFAATVSLIAFVIAGAVLIFGNDLSRFGQTIFYVILVISLIVFASNIIDGIITDGASFDGAVRELIATVILITMAALLALIQTAVLERVGRRRSDQA